jgi:GNAT superfamily N-acetyltransferase
MNQREGTMTIRTCDENDFPQVFAICNDAAQAYRGVIAADLWTEPYLSEAELRHEIAAGVAFFGAVEDVDLAGVMGLQSVDDVTLIRHAYTRTERQGHGVGSALLSHLRSRTTRPVLIGTWKAATWAIRFYELHGFRLIDDPDRAPVLRRYWTISERQLEESVVLADTQWFARLGCSE